METAHVNGTPLARYLEGEGYLDPVGASSTISDDDSDARAAPPCATDMAPSYDSKAFAPSNILTNPHAYPHRSLPVLAPKASTPNSFGRIHDAWSTALNSRLGRADNARFLEHFRYVIVASQLLNEYLDQGSVLPPHTQHLTLDGSVVATDAPMDGKPSLPIVSITLYGAAATAVVAFALVYLIHWARSSHTRVAGMGRASFVVTVFLALAFVGYTYVRRQWLKFLRWQALSEVSTCTTHWQSFEVSASSALSLIQEVELVSKGYRLCTPLPPASRVDDHASSRRCLYLRRALLNAYKAIIHACIDACRSLQTLIDNDDLERYFEIYDVSAQDAREALDATAASMGTASTCEDDPESLKSLRVLGYRVSVLRRVTLCSLMALEADGGKPDFARWGQANDAMSAVSTCVGRSAEKVHRCLSEMESFALASPITARSPSSHPAARDKMRGQVRKISMLSSGIRGLQAKMQILREETSRSIESSSEDLTDLGPNLMAQYESIGADLKDLLQAWEAGKASLQSNLNKQERRISLASSNMPRSPVSSLGGLTAVEENCGGVGGPADALKALTGADGLRSNRSSMATTPTLPSEAEDGDDSEVFEAVAMVSAPRLRSSLTREERIVKMQEERERLALLRAKRETNTSMLRELESVINLRPSTRKNGAMRITSL